MQHECVALLPELRRIDEPPSGSRARSREDRDILLAVDLERHRRRGKTGADIDLPQLVERGVIERRNGAVQEREKHGPPARRERAAVSLSASSEEMASSSSSRGASRRRNATRHVYISGS